MRESRTADRLEMFTVGRADETRRIGFSITRPNRGEIGVANTIETSVVPATEVRRI